MNFEGIEGAGSLDILYRGVPLDLYTMGILNVNIHDITQKVGVGLLSEAGLVEPTWKRPRSLPQRPPLPYQRIIQGRIQRVQIGSLEESVTFAVAAVLADPNVIAVLQNLSANIVWAIGISGVKGLRRHRPDRPNDFRWRRLDDDPLDIGPNLRDVLVAFAEHNDGHPAELRFVAHAGNEGEWEVALRVGG